MNNAPNSANEQSALSLLVSAAEGRDNAARREAAAAAGGLGGGAGSLAETLRLRGLSGVDAGAGGPSLEEQLMIQQQAQSLLGGGAGGSSMLLSQLRDQGFLSQLGGSLGAAGGQNQQLAALLGLGGGHHNPGNDVRSALAAQLRQSQQHHQQQQQQQAQPPQLTHADLLALTRSGALSSAGGMAGLLSRMGGAGGLGGLGSGLASELENLQRLEELERRQRIMSSAMGGSPSLTSVGAAGQPPLDASGGMRGSVLRDERLAGATHIPRPSGQEVGAKSKAAAPGEQASMMPPAANETSKEELEKTPGSVIVPCRARGMPMDHNFKVRIVLWLQCIIIVCVWRFAFLILIPYIFSACHGFQTAYFVIPENVKHGEELICSYFACRNAGIKFRYCSHCKVPVAKRNFRKRHKHGGDDIPRGTGDDSGGEEELPTKKGIPAHILAGQNDDALSSQSADSNPQEKSDLGVRRGLVQSSMRTFEKKKQPEVAKAQESDVSAKISTDRKERWAALLGKRPATKDGDSMSAWLMEVLAVSDLDTPLKSVDGTVSLCLDPPERIEEKAAEEDAKTPALPSFDGGIVKKKRPAVEAATFAEEPGKTAGGEAVSGSFAEWKERKKAKKQARLNDGSGSTDGPAEGPSE